MSLRYFSNLMVMGWLQWGQEVLGVSRNMVPVPVRSQFRFMLKFSEIAVQYFVFISLLLLSNAFFKEV